MPKIISINLNGIRSACKKGFLKWLIQQSADFVCVQELKAQAIDMSHELLAPYGYIGNFHYAQRKGYSGVGLYSKRIPDFTHIGFGTEEFDYEGRYLECHFNDLTIISLYCPSGSLNETRQQAKFRFMNVFLPYLHTLKHRRHKIIICGDWNIAHQEIDLKNWRSNQKNSGFLPEERLWLTRVFNELGFIDVYRMLYPTKTSESYTWWSHRGQAWTNNTGWRIDYQIATSQIAQKAYSALIYKETRFSDHAPLIINYYD